MKGNRAEGIREQKVIETSPLIVLKLLPHSLKSIIMMHKKVKDILGMFGLIMILISFSFKAKRLSIMYQSLP